MKKTSVLPLALICLALCLNVAQADQDENKHVKDKHVQAVTELVNDQTDLVNQYNKIIKDAQKRLPQGYGNIKPSYTDKETTKMNQLQEDSNIISNKIFKICSAHKDVRQNPDTQKICKAHECNADQSKCSVRAVPH
jgi:hypothetical protein